MGRVEIGGRADQSLREVLEVFDASGQVPQLARGLQFVAVIL